MTTQTDAERSAEAVERFDAYDIMMTLEGFPLTSVDHRPEGKWTRASDTVALAEKNAQLQADNERLAGEREQLALAICGGEDLPGYANAQTVEKLIGVADENRRAWFAATDRADGLQRQLDQALQRERGYQAQINQIAWPLDAEGGQEAVAWTQQSCLEIVKAGGQAQIWAKRDVAEECKAMGIPAFPDDVPLYAGPSPSAAVKVEAMADLDEALCQFTNSAADQYDPSEWIPETERNFKTLCEAYEAAHTAGCFSEAALSAPDAAGVTVPEGMQLVPIEPTEAMLNAPWPRVDWKKLVEQADNGELRALYRAMLAVANGSAMLAAANGSADA